MKFAFPVNTTAILAAAAKAVSPRTVAAPIATAAPDIPAVLVVADVCAIPETEITFEPLIINPLLC